MTNLQKMFNGDLAAADKWVVDMTSDSICSTCKIKSYCNEWNDSIYHENMCCMSAYLRWLLEEAKEILSNKNLGTARQAIGYKELQHYFDGQESLEEAIQKIKQETRRYAKRQLTWFRRNPDIHWIYVDCCRNVEEVSEQAALLLNFIE